MIKLVFVLSELDNDIIVNNKIVEELTNKIKENSLVISANIKIELDTIITKKKFNS